jgi:RNA polymerase sigma-70 factor (ECF subfamily)
LLLGYCAQRDSGVFAELVRRYEKALFGYLRHYLGNAEMAEDVFQQTFLQVHLKCDQFEPGRKVRPWLYTVATNQAIDYRRRNRRHRVSSLSRAAERNADEEAGALVELVGGPETGPADNAESAEQYDALRQAIDALTESSKQVVMLVYFQGLKYREAAQVLSIPVGTVKSRLHAAMLKLTESLSHVNLPS